MIFTQTDHLLISLSANDASRNIWSQTTSVTASLGSKEDGDSPEDRTRASERAWDSYCCADCLNNTWGT